MIMYSKWIQLPLRLGSHICKLDVFWITSNSHDVWKNIAFYCACSHMCGEAGVRIQCESKKRVLSVFWAVRSSSGANSGPLTSMGILLNRTCHAVVNGIKAWPDTDQKLTWNTDLFCQLAVKMELQFAPHMCKPSLRAYLWSSKCDFHQTCTGGESVTDI